MAQPQHDRKSASLLQQDHSDEILEHLPASFRVLAAFALKRTGSDGRE